MKKKKDTFETNIHTYILNQRAYFSSSKSTISDQKILNFTSLNINLEIILDLVIWSNYNRIKNNYHAKRNSSSK